MILIRLGEQVLLKPLVHPSRCGQAPLATCHTLPGLSSATDHRLAGSLGYLSPAASVDGFSLSLSTSLLSFQAGFQANIRRGPR